MVNNGNVLFSYFSGELISNQFSSSYKLCTVFASFPVGLQHLKELHMNSCKYVTDMSKLLPVKATLEQLDIGNCGGISDITPLNELK